MTNIVSKKIVFLLLFIILAIAIFFRFYKLTEIPPGLYPDVAMNGNDALAALKTGDFQVFYPENNGREGLFINLIALSFYFFGASVWAIKVVPAIIGVLTVLGLYLVVKELLNRISNFEFRISNQFSILKLNNSEFNQNSKLKIQNYPADNIALLTTFFLATGFWHVNFSRLGFRAIMVPFILVWGFYFLFRAIRMTRTLFLPSSDEEGSGKVLISIDNTPPQSSPQPRGGGNAPVCYKNIYWILSIGYWILAGLVFGLGFHTYISYRVAPLILGVFFLIEAYNFWQQKKSLTSNLLSPTSFFWPWLLFLVTIIIAASPMLIYFYNNPQDFMGRTGQVSVFNSATPIKDLTISKIKTLGMFNFWGDCNWRHNYACRPQLPYAIGILFLFGLFLCIGEIIKAIYKYIKKIPEPNQQRTANWSFTQISLFLLTWFVVMLLPAILTNEGVPHALRTIGVIPAVYIFVGIGGWWIFNRIKNYELRIKKFNKIFIFLVVLFCVWLVFYSYDLYFIRWGENPEVKGAFTQNYVDIGNYLNSLPENVQKYVIVNEGGVPVPYPNGIPVSAQTVIFTQRAAGKDKNTFYLKPDELSILISFISSKPQVESIVVLMKYDENILNVLEQKIPQGEIKKVDGIWTFQVKSQ